MLATPLTFLMLMKRISLDDVFEVRIILEGELAALAATRSSKDELALIRVHLDQMAARIGEHQKASYLEAEYELHNCIARAA
jgi:DNA-binding FadR family transcriptional regulator